MERNPPETRHTPDRDVIPEDSDSDSDSGGSRFRSKKATLEALDAIIYATHVSLSESNLRAEIKNNIWSDVYHTVIQLPPLQQRSRPQIEQLSELRLVAIAEEVLVNLRFLCEFSHLPGG